MYVVGVCSACLYVHACVCVHACMCVNTRNHWQVTILKFSLTIYSLLTTINLLISWGNAAYYMRMHFKMRVHSRGKGSTVWMYQITCNLSVKSMWPLCFWCVFLVRGKIYKIKKRLGPHSWSMQVYVCICLWMCVK